MTNQHPPIQIVDENDKPIGSMSIGEAHKKGAIHRIVRIMVANPETKQLLLQKRAANMRSWPNCWSESAAGHVDTGEDYLTAARRELSEELGINTDKLIETDAYYSENKRQDGLPLKRFNRLYKFYSKAQEFNIQESEVSEVRWFTIDDIKELFEQYPEKVTDGLKYVIEKYYS